MRRVLFCLPFLFQYAHAQTSFVSVAGVLVDENKNRVSGVCIDLALHQDHRPGKSLGFSLGSDCTNNAGVYNLSTTDQVAQNIRTFYISCDDRSYEESVREVVLQKVDNQSIQLRIGKASDLMLYKNKKVLNKKQTKARLNNAAKTEAYKSEILEDYGLDQAKSSFAGKAGSLFNNYENGIKDYDELMNSLWFDLQTISNTGQGVAIKEIFDLDFLLNVKFTKEFQEQKSQLNDVRSNNQKAMFTVIASTGKNLVKSKKGSYEQMSLGRQLYENEELKISKGSYLGLIRASGQALELTSSGKLTVAELTDMIRVDGSEILKEYTSFLTDNLERKEQEGYRKWVSMQVTSKSVGKPIDVFLPRMNQVMGERIVVSWEGQETQGDETYVVSLKNNFDEEMISQEVRERSCTLDLTKDQLGNDSLFVLTVKLKGAGQVRSETIGLRKLREDQVGKYKQDIEKIEASFQPNSPLRRIVLASYFEKNGFIAEALSEYNDLIEENEQVSDFRVLRKDVLERNGIQIFED
ncbi:MAG: hypothetical protein ABJF04_06280 [Reichenbachiella sp.]|uniref:hypothetical protein n=1 Tax=Reichenbachiella sp. TaxID=2184521 RepID=UPI003264217C